MNIPKLRFKDNNGNDYPQWEKKKLEDISTITMGQSPDSNFINNEEIGIAFLQGNAEFTNKYPIEKYWCTKPQKTANPTDILLSVRAPVGAINIANKEFCIGRGLSAISFNCNKIFGKYNLEYNLFQLIKKSQGSTFSSINKKDISEIILFIPSFKEQKKIANFLSTVDKKIENLENTISSLENQKKGLLQQIFSQKLRFKDKNGNNYPNWEKKKIGLICSISTGKSNTQDKIDNGKYPFYVRSATIERSSKYLYDEEATLTVGDGVGTGKVFHYVNGKYDLHQRCYRMFNFKNTHAKYFYYFFSSHFYNRVKRMSAKNSVDSVRMNMISDMIIDLPCLEEQTKIADFLSAFDHKLENQKAQLEHWQQIKKGLLQQMFV
ncbi:restriction endonuclease subunit S [uncultured Megamonas sp.]|uniref:restriction endonuclease subunit S n=1 Tax=uncultured Megamonas sp. TaxID=286140 RepID=UPI00259661B0|nr:restriction endonuclease subunit S [uncultured Megamonas sp.]